MHENMKINIIIKYLTLIFISVLFIGCKSNSNLEGVSFETAKHYNKFLFIPAKNTPTSKSLEINFNEWARHNNSHVTLMMGYNNSNNSSLSYFGTESCPLVTLYLNGEKCVGGKVKLDTKILVSGKRFFRTN